MKPASFALILLSTTVIATKLDEQLIPDQDINDFTDCGGDGMAGDQCEEGLVCGFWNVQDDGDKFIYSECMPEEMCGMDMDEGSTIQCPGHTSTAKAHHTRKHKSFVEVVMSDINGWFGSQY
eukprot:CAMPEP_0170482012 /NCGR_PEP_ID=MMETSP0208-20121228/2224_1 /TAXON_ID=197538 /ORGANISM="Strombidium inclinatum, Strain S3" /LENGTH=121 /DNA_ID=CAMNT_0010754805 /DNA_START=28 /DNA_END=393 /DNA_ORIENTATION=+